MASLKTEMCQRSFAGQTRHTVVGDDRKACCSMLFNMLKLQKARNRDVFPGANPVSIERANIHQLRAEPYWVAAKTDGDRALLMAVTLRDARLCLLIDRCMTMHILTGHLPTSSFENSLLDGELVQVGGRWKFLVFDCIYLGGIDVSAHRFSVRLDLVRSWLEDIGQGLDGIGVEVKEFGAVDLGSTPNIPNHAHMPDDGLIFVPEHQPYGCYRNDTLLKWKPPGHHTVDFQVSGAGRLMVQSKSKLVEKGTLHPDDQSKVVEGNIVECRLDGQVWRLTRVRSDKTVPNDQYVLGKTIFNMQENIQRSEFFV